jgi:Transmembrane domain of unknown function (DUF3566)
MSATPRARDLRAGPTRSSTWVEDDRRWDDGERHVTLRKVDPWSVLKLSLLFSFCALLVVMLGLTVFWTAVNRVGMVGTLLAFLEDFGTDVRIDGVAIARAIFLFGLLGAVLWSGINVFLAFLYNLVADLVGGLRVTVSDED